MIYIKPCDFIWPDTKDQSYKQLLYGEYLIKDIMDVIQIDFQIGSPIYIYGDEQFQILLADYYTLIEYGIPDNGVLYARKQLYADNLIAIKITIDDNLQGFVIQTEYTASIHDIIIELQESQQIQEQIIELKLLDQNNGQQLTTNKLMRFNQFPIKNFQLQLYTKPTNLVKENIFQTIIQPKDLLQQLIIFPKFSILVDRDSEFIAYKYHHPLDIKGLLFKQKAKQLNINDETYDFKTINNIQYAQTDEFGLIVKWGNQLYSEIKVKQEG